jgi:hypothetical protein
MEIRYFKKVLKAVSEGDFYNYYVKLPDPTSVSDYICKNPKFFPFFVNALGALDGTHINSWTTAANWHANRDCKGSIMQNCLAVCSFEF